MIANNIGISACEQQFFSGTRAALGSIERKTLSMQVLAKTDPVTHLAQNYRVSRKFLYQQALDRTFNPSEPNKEVLYHLPITKDWIRQFTLSLVLVGHSSFAPDNEPHGDRKSHVMAIYSMQKLH